MYVGIDEREDDGYKRRGDEIGDERIGSHRLKVAAQLDRHHRSRSRSRPDDATKHGLHEHEPRALGVEDQDKTDYYGNEEHLRQSYPKVPSHRPQSVIVHLAEGDEQDEKHEPRQDGVEQRAQSQRRRL